MQCRSDSFRNERSASPNPHWADTRTYEPLSDKSRACSLKGGQRCFPCQIEPFRYYQYGKRAVHLDGCVEVEAAYYGAPPGWIGRTPLSTQQLLIRADKTRKHIGALCRPLQSKHAQVAVLRILGVLARAKKYGIASTDDVRALALETGACEYHFVRRYLERTPQLPLCLRQVDPLIQQLTLYRDLVESRTRQEETS